AAVVSVPGAIEADADHGPLPFAFFGKDGRDMGAMMLDGQLPVGGKFECVHGRGVLRMGVMHDEQIIPWNLVHLHQILDSLSESAKRFIGGKIANVLADESLPLHNEGDRVFQVWTDGEDGRLTGELGKCSWGIAA